MEKKILYSIAKIMHTHFTLDPQQSGPPPTMETVITINIHHWEGCREAQIRKAAKEAIDRVLKTAPATDTGNI